MLPCAKTKTNTRVGHYCGKSFSERCLRFFQKQSSFVTFTRELVTFTRSQLLSNFFFFPIFPRVLFRLVTYYRNF